MEQLLSRLAKFDFAERDRLVKLAKLRYREVLEFEKPNVVLCDRDPVQFLAGFVAACSAPCHVFLCNPDWGGSEWRQVLEFVKPSLVWGESEGLFEIDHSLESVPGLFEIDRSLELVPGLFETDRLSHSPAPEWNSGLTVRSPLKGTEDELERRISQNLSSHLFASNLIMIPTGGTSGNVRFAMHNWETLSASVQGFRQYFETDRIHSYCVLPLYHVSGLMQFMRSFLTDGRFITQSWKTLDTQFDPQDFFISLVPTQLQQLMNHADWLAKFKTILLGGAPAWSDLLEEARSRNLPIAPTYGMTETASQIATLKPADFLSGIEGCGRVLPHAEITCSKADPSRIANQKLRIQAKSLMLGYYPNFLPEPTFDPDDLGYFDDRQFLHLIGRASNKIISGGENIFPSEVEAAVRSTNLIQDIHVLGTLDPVWGQSVTAIFVPGEETITIDQIKTELRSRLASFKHPKRWIKVNQIPRTAQGKIIRDRIEEIIKLSEHL
ncbi:2-succinylbenzoate--CoA ligase [Leptolyngbya sp. NIES-2104]|uniref:2-succinylbenzoate--CoA ligase n=1 Tax=Leptolyngbya sp. NIES-2104 TaxID=1552121 RepID=UPI0006ECBAD7|nr:2-succinylbenzoate--CoA ligase [Leptolyngbya sp. NIES-2104]GAP98645.1 o-succinylbenzoic acid--CoA ligase [Leptolyngbya sp. NIES-2104]